jgi:hypothetical protein
VLGVTATLLWPAIGYPMLGVALLGLVWWLVAHDVARRTIRAGGLARFMAGCLLAGYAWLAVAAPPGDDRARRPPARLARAARRLG